MKIIGYFIHSAGAALLALALALLLGICAGWDDLLPHDPLANVPLRPFFAAAVAAQFAVALVCLFGRNLAFQSALVLWLAVEVLFYRLGLAWLGVPGGFRGYLGDVAAALGLSTGTINLAVQGAYIYMAVGGIAACLWSRRCQRRTAADRQLVADQREACCAACGKPMPRPDGHLGETLPCPHCHSTRPGGNAPSHGLAPTLRKPRVEALVRTLKIACAACGGRIEFPTNVFGEQISCPHCRAVITLQKPVNLKMTCPDCSGHLEFPNYALGQKIPCPHCQTGLVLTTQSPGPKA